MNLSEVVSQEVQSEDRVLDLGCGIFLHTLDLKCGSNLGVDIWKEGLEKVKDKLPSNFAVIHLDITVDLKYFLDRSFDVVLALDVIEHLEKPLELVEEMERIAKKKVVIYTPHKFFSNVQAPNSWSLKNPWILHKSLISPEMLAQRGYQISYPISTDPNYLAVKRMSGK